ERDAGLLVVALGREEHHADAVAAGCWKADPLGGALAPEERVGNLDQDAGAVAGERIAAAGAAMGEVLQHGERLLDDVVGALALDVHHEADAAGVAFGPRVQKSLRHATLSLPAPRALRFAACAARGAASPCRPA